MNIQPKDPIMMRSGGFLSGKGGPRPKNILIKLKQGAGEDYIPSILAAGEIVIPKKHARTVSTFLRKRKIKLPTVYV